MHAKEAPAISLKDKFVLSPIEKHIYYKKFPYKLVIHLLLVIVTTIQVSTVIDSAYTFHAREQFRVFKYIFLDSTDESNTQQYLTINDFQDHLQGLLEDFRALDDQLYQNYLQEYTTFSMGVYFTRQYSQNLTFLNSTFPIDIYSGKIGPLDPFNISSIKSFMGAITLASIQVNNIITLINNTDGSTQCMAWNISISYNFESYSAVSAQISGGNKYCTIMSESGMTLVLQGFERGSMGINLIVLALSLVSLVLSIRHIYAVATIYMTTRYFYKKYQKDRDDKSFQKQKVSLLRETSTDEINLKDFLDKDLPWEKMPFSQKLRFFNFWFIFGIIGNCFQTIGSISIILTFESDVGQNILTVDNIFIGFGCACAWFQLMYYLKFNRSIVLMSSTLQKSFVENIVFFGLIIPIFVGFAIVGQAFFWAYDKFQSTGTSMQSLFALFCGDIVYETYMDTINETTYKQVYIFVYLLCFYTAVQNIFVAIVMEGYDRCTLRKEIDNDDPFPLMNNLMDSLRKEQNSLQRSQDIPPEGQSEIDSLEHEDDPAQACVNRLNTMKNTVLQILKEMSETYHEKDDLPLSIL